MHDDDDIYRPAGLGGDGWWSDRWDDAKREVKSVAKRIQKNPVVRATEKKLVKKGADLLRGAAETATDGLADSALTSLGVPTVHSMSDGSYIRHSWDPSLVEFPRVTGDLGQIACHSRKFPRVTDFRG